MQLQGKRVEPGRAGVVERGDFDLVAHRMRGLMLLCRTLGRLPRGRAGRWSRANGGFMGLAGCLVQLAFHGERAGTAQNVQRTWARERKRLKADARVTPAVRSCSRRWAARRAPARADARMDEARRRSAPHTTAAASSRGSSCAQPRGAAPYTGPCMAACAVASACASRGRYARSSRPAARSGDAEHEARKAVAERIAADRGRQRRDTISARPAPGTRRRIAGRAISSRRDRAPRARRWPAGRSRNSRPPAKN